MQKVETIEVGTIKTGDFSPVGPRRAHDPKSCSSASSDTPPGWATLRHTLCYHIFRSVASGHSQKSPHQSPPKGGLKSPGQKSPPMGFLTKKSAVPPGDFSPGRGSKVPHTFDRCGSSKMVLTSKMCLTERLHHEDHKN